MNGWEVRSLGVLSFRERQRDCSNCYRIYDYTPTGPTGQVHCYLAHGISTGTRRWVIAVSDVFGVNHVHCKPRQHEELEYWLL